MKTYTSDFVTFSPAEKFMTGAGMDITLGVDNTTSTFYRIGKNDGGELIELASSSTLSGDQWTPINEEIGAGTIPAGEGPLFFQNNQDPTKVCPSSSLLTPESSESEVSTNTKNIVAHLYRLLHPERGLYPIRNNRPRWGRLDGLGRLHATA